MLGASVKSALLTWHDFIMFDYENMFDDMKSANKDFKFRGLVE